jgi:hypothetical protein
MRSKNSKILRSLSINRLLLPLVALSAFSMMGCNPASGPTDAFDILPPTITSEFGQLEFAAAPTTGLPNTCIGPFVVQIQDGSGNALGNESGNNVGVSLVESSGTATFYTDSVCSQAIDDPNGAGPSIAAGETSVGFYLDFPAMESDVTITATADADFSIGSNVATTTLNVN